MTQNNQNIDEESKSKENPFLKPNDPFNRRGISSEPVKKPIPMPRTVIRPATSPSVQSTKPMPTTNAFGKIIEKTSANDTANNSSLTEAEQKITQSIPTVSSTTSSNSSLSSSESSSRMSFTAPAAFSATSNINTPSTTPSFGAAASKTSTPSFVSASTTPTPSAFGTTSPSTTYFPRQTPTSTPSSTPASPYSTSSSAFGANKSAGTSFATASTTSSAFSAPLASTTGTGSTGFSGSSAFRSTTPSSLSTASKPAGSSFGSTSSSATYSTRPTFGEKPVETPPARSTFLQQREEKPSPFAKTSSSTTGLFGSAPAARDSLTAAMPMANRGELKINDEEFILLRDFIYQQCGIFIAENRKYLVENRLSPRLRELGLRSYAEYYKYLRYDGERKGELNKLFESMTTNETSFFRNNPQLDVFRDVVLKKVLDECRSKQKKLRIWSAGCSSGEEPYTIAIILSEVLGGDLPNWDIKITANDLSTAVLATAQEGLYSEYALRTTPPSMIQKYFIKEGQMYRILPQLKKMIYFEQMNLNDKNQTRKVERSQIVFCRNVIIYFDDDVKKNVIGAFYDNLLDGGYLIIGHSESLHNISRAFKPDHYAGSIIYSKQM